MKALYVDGNTAMHRLSARSKLFALAGISVCLFLTRSPVPLSLALAAAALVYFRLGLPVGPAVRRVLPVFLTIVVVAAFALVFTSTEEALVTLLRLMALMLLAAAVTATTGISDFIDEITRLALPLERTGLLRAADIGLAVGLVIRFVPDILSRHAAIREAHVARGLRVRTQSVLVALVILTLRDADQVAAAIDARGFRRQ